VSDKEDPLKRKIALYSARHGDSALRIKRVENPPSLILYISGALDTATSSDLFDFIISAKDLAGTCGGLIVDFSGLHYISSTGIGVFSTAMLEYGRERIDFRLRAVPPRIKALFESLGLWNYFTIMENPDK